MAIVLQRLECPPILINSVEDHVHLLFELARTVSLSQAVEDVKKSSSKWIKTQGVEFVGFAWQAGYGPLESVNRMFNWSVTTSQSKGSIIAKKPSKRNIVLSSYGITLPTMNGMFGIEIVPLSL